MLIRMGMGTQLSGSVGGVVASHNKGGAYLRGRSVPTNPNSARQQTVRSAFAASAIGWAGLTVEQREAWEGYAALTAVTNRIGESITVSGFNMYVRANSFRGGAGAAVVAAAPRSLVRRSTLRPTALITSCSMCRRCGMGRLLRTSVDQFVSRLRRPMVVSAMCSKRSSRLVRDRA